MLWRYPGLVGSHNLEDPSFDGTEVLVWDNVDVWPRRWQPQRWRVSHVDTGVTQDIAQRGVCRSGRESVMQ